MKHISIYEKWCYWDSLPDRQFYLLPTISFDGAGHPIFWSLEFRFLYLIIGVQCNYEL
jgi:hypothetical protein